MNPWSTLIRLQTGLKSRTTSYSYGLRSWFCHLVVNEPWTIQHSFNSRQDGKQQSFICKVNESVERLCEFFLQKIESEVSQFRW